MEWIESKTTQLSMSQPMHGSGSNLHSQASVQVALNSLSTELVGSVNTLDPICSRTKGAPKKLRKKSPLEKSSKKSKVCKLSNQPTYLCLTQFVCYYIFNILYNLIQNACLNTICLA